MEIYWSQRKRRSRLKNNRRGGEGVQPFSKILMERMMMTMVTVICWSDWMKHDRLNVVGIPHIILIEIVYLSIICHKYNI